MIGTKFTISYRIFLHLVTLWPFALLQPLQNQLKSLADECGVRCACFKHRKESVFVKNVAQKWFLQMTSSRLGVLGIWDTFSFP